MCDDDTAIPADHEKDLAFGTKLIHSGNHPDEWTYKDVIPPISLSTIYNAESPGVIQNYEYTRCGNPIRSVLEKCLMAMDNAKYALVYSSGMSATMSMVSMLAPGDHILCSSDVYGGTYRLLSIIAKQAGILFDFIDFINTENIVQNIKPNTKLVWFESLSNPLMRVLDVKKVSDVVHRIRTDILVAVDNSFITPYFQKPLNLGVDVIMYSLSKYINGHSDALMGALVTNNKELYDKLYVYQYTCGNVPSSFDCYMVNRGLKTLHVRMEHHMKNAFVVAQFLRSHPKVLKVNYVGFPDHPQRDVINKQFTGYTGLLSFYINGGLKESVKLLESLKLFYITVSFGCYESLAALPTKMTHASLTDEQKYSIGIYENLVRLSIGLEYVQDLIDDLNQALEASGAKDKTNTTGSINVY
ncbi:Pyridoxal phosphate-dependent transferase, subdomain 2,Pyridoxal phosphate-dependent transferase [Cinara cedri]|uniref:cystathionine gamma-lyase n=1 Tax=Cinara cedri TaxID=506608 RepID=A0A5E4MQW7_9HEMI|nr:Pyridoxal phosphate-dependent transferase, subdomain 2,Pyridoxal phosphate-dependent transferase [Cinara cedri]